MYCTISFFLSLAVSAVSSDLKMEMTVSFKFSFKFSMNLKRSLDTAPSAVSDALALAFVSRVFCFADSRCVLGKA